MKQIINGKRYDTDKALEVGEWSNGFSPRDFHHCYETLYRKRTGEYFLYGQGGPMSKYARTIGQNQWSGDSVIKPLTFEEARLWAEKHLSADEYETEFGEVAEDDSRTVLSITLSVAVADHARREAAKAGMSLSAWIEQQLK